MESAYALLRVVHVLGSNHVSMGLRAACWSYRNRKMPMSGSNW